MLTRRWSAIPSRQKNGISVVASQLESEYDSFGAGHGCNSISAGLGKSQLPIALFYYFFLALIRKTRIRLS